MTNKLEIYERLYLKILPIDKFANYKDRYFYGYSKGGNEVEFEKAKNCVDIDNLSNKKVRQTVMSDIGFATEFIDLAQHYFSKKRPNETARNENAISLFYDMLSCIAVRRINKMLYPKQQLKEKPERRHWFHDPLTGERRKFFSNEVPDGWKKGMRD